MAMHQFSDTALRFVIQKHQASHLHYDLRLEYEGALKSWAIPRGPSLDPLQKKLAIMVEDHPLEYRNFEGNIPEGNYGAGTVMIWDEGTYQIPGARDKSEAERILKEFIEKGHLTFNIEGRKLRGVFHLVKLHRYNLPNGWLLIKKQDIYATEVPIPNDDKSVRSGRTMEQIKRNEPSEKFYSNPDLNTGNIRGAKKSSFPTGPLHPMLAKLIDQPFDREGWIFEIKWDGYRAIAEIRNNSVQLYSRNGVSFLNDYDSVINDLKKIDFEAIFDGEIVVVSTDGKADFNLLQNYGRTKAGVLLYFVFDILYLQGYDLRSTPLIQRKSLLKQVLPALDHIRYNEHIEQNGIAFYKLALENRIEGIIAKDQNSPYMEGKRSNYWQKIKISMQQEFVIGGFSQSKAGRTGFGALLIGVYQDSELVYTGSVGGGFSNDELPLVRQRLEKLKSNRCPFSRVPDFNNKVTWVNPEIVCEVKFAEWTSEGLLRQPVFLGFREDLSATEVKRELLQSLNESEPQYSAKPSDESITTIESRILKLTNLKKVYFPSDNITKGKIIEYYRKIASIILPHLQDRPIALHRFPDGIHGKAFFQKNIEDAPQWVSTVTILSDSRQICYILCQDEPTLAYIVNLGSIEINPWSSRLNSIDFPDYMVIDLDPLECSFKYVIDCALMIHEILTSIDMPHYVKTSGATGLHLFIPVGAHYSFEQVRQFTFIVCTLINKKLPSITSLERVPQKRIGRVYLDYLQNSRGKTMVAPYSIRPIEGAPVSTPLLWEEINYQLKPDQFTINSILPRIRNYGDIWKPVIGKGVDLLNSLNHLAALF
ncbi:MAG TPA: DNA ligase D [Chitinispirillaceae bacterium]|nr:DNA ligase D [Chitinispirillaceae bacterium]